MLRQPRRLTSDSLQTLFAKQQQSVPEKMRCTFRSVLCRILWKGQSYNYVHFMSFFSTSFSFKSKKADIFHLCQIEHGLEEFFYMWMCKLLVCRRRRRMTTITTMSMMTVITFLKEPSSHINMWPSIFRKAILNCHPAKRRKKIVRANAIDLSVIVWIVTGHVHRIAENVECHTWQVVCLCPSANMEMRWITHRT